ncbi:MAG: phosphatidylserine decarboxylase [Acidobacteria bacterium]|nr:phosphatidylserine decarboxylase [Acidobacteriota bacterium]
MVADGIRYAVGLAAVGAVAAALGGPLWAVPELLLAAFVLYFFRDPDRTSPAGDVIVSPADGRVVDVRETELEGRPLWKISIFLNIFNVHVNRSPIAGVIRKIEYCKGCFLVASRAEASLQNEQNTVTIEGERFTVVFKQIAGLIARRIVFTKKVGDRVACGERVGLIKFGSRVDVFFPHDIPPSVAIGDKVYAGVSVLGSLSQAQPVARAGSHTPERTGARSRV